MKTAILFLALFFAAPQDKEEVSCDHYIVFSYSLNYRIFDFMYEEAWAALSCGDQQWLYTTSWYWDEDKDGR